MRELQNAQGRKHSVPQLLRFLRSIQTQWMVPVLITLLVLAGCAQPAALESALTPILPPPTYTPTPAPPPDTGPNTRSDSVGPPGEPVPVTVGLSLNLPEFYVNPLLAALTQTSSVTTATGERPLRFLDRSPNAATTIGLAPLAQAQHPIVSHFYAVVVPFATVSDDTTLEAVRARWQGAGSGPLLVADDTADNGSGGLAALLGGPPAESVRRVSISQLLAELEQAPGGWGILPFDQLDPRYKVLHVDGVNLLSNQLDPAAYPLAVALAVKGEEADAVAALLRQQSGLQTNRDADRLTTLIMTGVTAMSRATAAKMERKGYTYPADVISPTLRAADITHVSNEVPFLDDCQVNNTLNNLILCSHTNYSATLKAIGTDIVGLSGNHVNDFGREGARESIQFYRRNDIPIYGSGLNVEEACAPLLWTHNGNRFAFFAALAFWPRSAWATEDEPGACYYFDNKERILAKVEELRPQVDIIAVELQHTETYNPYPTAEQVADFRELRRAGVDIVTGVQSHVPQALEPYGPSPERPPSIIVYGLGNLFFDQMWSWETRTELIARHTIYAGQLLNTEILTAVLEDFAQPRWATDSERAEILQRIFQAAPPRPQ